VGPLDDGGGTIAEALDFRKAAPRSLVMVSFLYLPPHANLPEFADGEGVYPAFSTALAYCSAKKKSCVGKAAQMSGREGRRWPARALALMRRWHNDDSGVTAIEFAIVAMPFLLMMFGIMSVCLFYFANFSIENAVWQAARALRTGQVQQSQGAYAGAVTNADRKIAFKKALCERAPTFLKCNDKAIVIVQSNANFSGIHEPNCVTNGTMITDAAAGFDIGGGSSVLLVTVCYPWELGGKLPFFKMGNLSDGSLLMQASVAFRTEPYN
jgi:hypothetical protein